MEKQRTENEKRRKRIARIVRKALKIVMVTILGSAIFLTNYAVVSYTPARWYLRFYCLCGRAHLHAGERFTPDGMLFREIGWQELSDKQIRIVSKYCKLHNERITITIYGDKEYTVQSGGR